MFRENKANTKYEEIVNSRKKKMLQKRMLSQFTTWLGSERRLFYIIIIMKTLCVDLTKNR